MVRVRPPSPTDHKNHLAISPSPPSSTKFLLALLLIATTTIGTATTAVASGTNHHHRGHCHASSADALLFISPSAPRARSWVTGVARGDSAAFLSSRWARRSSWGNSGAVKQAGAIRKRDIVVMPGGGTLRMTSSAGEGEGGEEGKVCEYGLLHPI